MAKVDIFELVLAAVLSVAIGLSFSLWSMLYAAVTPILTVLGIKHILSGFWLIAGLLPAFIIRRAGIAIFSETLAALIEAFISQWGIMACAFGFVQGIGAEIIFALFLYKHWNLLTLSLAAMCSALFSYALEYVYYGQWTLNFSFHARQLLVFGLSSILFGALPAWYLAKKLVKTGLLNNFKIVTNAKKPN